MTIDWKRKLTSRKFWVTICDFVTMIVIAFGVSENVAVQISAIIMAGAGCVAYIFGEGLADSAETIVVNSKPELYEELE